MELVVRGIERYQVGDLTGALSDFNDALRIDAACVEARTNRGVIRHDLGDLTGALADFDEALRVNPRHTATYCNRAKIRRAMGDGDGANADLDMSLAIRGDSAYVRGSRGFHRVMQRDFLGAITEFNAAIEIDARYCWAYIGRGNARYHLLDMTPANLDFRTAFTINPDFYATTRSKTTLADSRDSKGTFADCERHFERDADDFLALARRGLLLLMLDRDDEAQQDFDRYFFLSPTDRARLERTIHEVKARRRTR